MANYDISTSTVIVSTSKGPKTYYSFDVINPETGQVVEAMNTTNPDAAKKFFDKVKTDDPTVTVNGKINSDPFTDGTFEAQGDFEFDIAAQSGENFSVYSDQDTQKKIGPPTLSTRETIETSRLTTPTRYLRGLSKQRRKEYEKLTEEQKCSAKINGAFGNKRIQPMCSRDDVPSETIVGRGKDNNAFIVIGNDRVDKAHTGYGGKGHTGCDAIDLVTGLGGANPVEVEQVRSDSGETTENKVKVNQNFFLDAARIYISQKTDVDKNFGIGEFGNAIDQPQTSQNNQNIGKYGGKSAIAVKADNIRVIGRESIRIVTGTDKFNSKNGETYGSGVELIAMNNVDTLQPLVLGDNLQLALTIMLDNMEALAEVMHAYIKYQMKFNQSVQTHTHLSPFFAKPTLTSEAVIAGGIQCDIATASKTELSILKHITNIQGIKHNFLTDSGESFINSRLNKAN